MKAFQCQICGECCHGEGGIFVNKDEIKKITNFLEMTEESFLAEFCLKKGGRFSIKAGPNKFCIFYDHEKRCLIHPVKPLPCSLWPFYPAILKDVDNWEMAKDACPGINPECSFEEFVRQSKDQESVN